MISADSLRGRIALGVAHCAGLIDLVALPLWIGALIGHYHLDTQQAGLLLTLFLAGAVCASLIVAPLFNKISGRFVAVMGYAGAAWAIFKLSNTAEFSQMALFHAMGGLCIGTALSVKDGTVARSANPHRLFSIMGAALGIFALVFLSIMPTVITQHGGPILFTTFAGVMVIAALTALLAFPTPAKLSKELGESILHETHSRAVWFGIFGICLMSLNQAMSFSFLNQVGSARGFSADKINMILATLGLINLCTPVLAGFLQNTLSARTVLMAGPLVQGALVFTVFNATSFELYATSGALFVAVMIFTHIFAFGFIAKLETTGRVLAGTPAMVMTGAALGPILGGTLAKYFGFSAIGYTAIGVALVAFALFSRLPKPRVVARSTLQSVATESL